MTCVSWSHGVRNAIPRGHHPWRILRAYCSLGYNGRVIPYVRISSKGSAWRQKGKISGSTLFLTVRTALVFMNMFFFFFRTCMDALGCSRSNDYISGHVFFYLFVYFPRSSAGVARFSLFFFIICSQGFVQSPKLQVVDLKPRWKIAERAIEICGVYTYQISMY